MALKRSAVPIGENEDCWESKVRLKQLLNQKFATVLSDQDLSTSCPHYYQGFMNCPRAPASVKASGSSEWKMTANNYRISLDLDEFEADEFSVTSEAKFVEVRAKHKEKEDQHGLVSREFCRRYLLPRDCDSEAVRAFFSSDRKLIIEAPWSGKEPEVEMETIVVDYEEYREQMQRQCQEEYKTTESESLPLSSTTDIDFKELEDVEKIVNSLAQIAAGDFELPVEPRTDEETEVSGETKGETTDPVEACIGEETGLPGETATDLQQDFIPV